MGKESINLSAVADMTRLDSDRRHSPRLVGAKLAHQKAYRLRVVDPKVRRYARCRHFLFSFPLKGTVPLIEKMCVLYHIGAKNTMGSRNFQYKVIASSCTDFSPPYRFNCLWACSFHFSFHDLRLVLEPSDFVISPERSERLQRLNEGCGEAGEVGDVRCGKALVFHLADALVQLFNCRVTFRRRRVALG